jgi:hypothetical protein
MRQADGGVARKRDVGDEPLCGVLPPDSGLVTDIRAENAGSRGERSARKPE